MFRWDNLNLINNKSNHIAKIITNHKINTKYPLYKYLPIHKVGTNDNDKLLLPGINNGNIFANTNTDDNDIILIALSLLLA